MPSDDGEAPFRAVSCRCERVDGRDLEGKLDAAHAGQVDGQAEKVWAVGKWGESPGEGEREVVLVRRRHLFWQVEHGVLECQKNPGIHLESQVEVERAAAALLGVQVDLPCLAERVRLDEVPLVMDMKSMVDGVVLQVCHVSRDIYYCHSSVSLIAIWCAPA